MYHHPQAGALRGDGEVFVGMRDFVECRHSDGTIDSADFKAKIRRLALCKAQGVLPNLHPPGGFDVRSTCVSAPRLERAPAPPLLLRREDVRPKDMRTVWVGHDTQAGRGPERAGEAAAKELNVPNVRGEMAKHGTVLAVRLREKTNSAGANRNWALVEFSSQAAAMKACGGAEDSPSHGWQVRHATQGRVHSAEAKAAARQRGEAAEDGGARTPQPREALSADAAAVLTKLNMAELADVEEHVKAARAELENLRSKEPQELKRRASARHIDRTHPPETLISGLLPHITLQKRLEDLHLLGGSFPYDCGQAPNPWLMGLSQRSDTGGGIFGNGIVHGAQDDEGVTESRAKITRYEAYGVPIQFHSHDEPLDLLKMCVDVCGDTADVGIFHNGIVKALETYAACRFRDSQDMHVARVVWLFRMFNFLWCGMVFASAWFSDPEEPGYSLWGAVWSDLVVLGSLWLFLGFALCHGLVNMRALRVATWGWSFLLGSKKCVPGWIHHGINVQLASVALVSFSYCAVLDIYLAANQLRGPVEAPGMAGVRQAIRLGQMFRVLATFGALPGCLIGVEGLVNAERTQLLVAIARSLAEMFSILRFVIPFIGGSALMLDNALNRVDAVSHPEIKDLHHNKVQTFFTTTDYLFGAGESSRYLMREESDWMTLMATVTHIFFMILISLVTTNLLIAIVGDCWNESGEDAKAWRHYGASTSSLLERVILPLLNDAAASNKHTDCCLARPCGVWPNGPQCAEAACDKPLVRQARPRTAPRLLPLPRERPPPVWAAAG